MLVHTVDAEYPCFSLINAMGVFNIDEVDDLAVDKEKSLRRCAKKYEVSPTELEFEYADLLPYAQKFYQSAPSKGSTEAWKTALEQT